MNEWTKLVEKLIQKYNKPQMVKKLISMTIKTKLDIELAKQLREKIRGG